MKTFTIAMMVFCFSHAGLSQEQSIVTKSVSLENIIPFVVDHLNGQEEDTIGKNQKITILLQTSDSGLFPEDKIILKQALKLLSQRSTTGDSLSVVTYSGFNGIALEMTSTKNIKSIMYGIEHLRQNISEFQKDGIELAYRYAKQHAESDTNNIVLMIRNPKASSNLVQSTSSNFQTETVTKDPAKNNNAVLLTAIGLLPQIISVIKD